MTTAIIDGQEMRIARIIYNNHKGQTATRTIVPGAIRFGECEYHKGPQWLMDAFDLEKKATRTFAMRDISRWL